MSRPAVDPPEWLRTLPVAPEYRPTGAEFADPIGYILKIEPEASRYGICKIVPPLPSPPFEATLERLRASFAANAAAAGDATRGPTFPTRLQQVGLSAKNRRAANRRVWESGESYTLEAFRAKARDFELPRHAAPPNSATPLQLEALFWGACAAKPFNVEYGNDMPGSGFAAPEELEMEPRAGGNAALAARDVGETEWNMRLAPRAQGSLLRAMGRDVAGVTTPMLYVAMLYSWFAWHVEDHELHSLNYLHFGKAKTWYGVPRDAILAFEDAVRVHGYADDLNAIMAFQTLNEKTTVLSPEVLLSAGVPCCRLVQNPGEFIITFPGAYHSGFSHGFNCGEATNIATPRWLQVAKEAAIRRASTNCGPMVSHYQLLYELALSLCPREPKNFHSVPRSSRLRDKKKNEGEIMVKETFVGSVIENNNFLSILLGQSSCIIIPEIAFPLPSFPTMMAPEVTVKQGLIHGPCGISHQKAEDMLVDGDTIDKIKGVEDMSESQSTSATTSSSCNRRKLYETKFGKVNSAAFCLATSEIQNGVIEKGRSHQGGGLLDQGRLPCVQCGILSFACVAIIQPKEAAVQFVISRGSISSSAKHGEIMKSDDISNWIAENREIVPPQGHASGTDDNIICSISSAQVPDWYRQLYSSSTHGCTSALGLLASAYDSSESDEEAPDNISNDSENNDAAKGVANIESSETSVQLQKTNLHLYEVECGAKTTASLMKPVENKSMTLTQASRETYISHLAGLGEPLTSYEEWSAYLDLDDDLTASGVKASSDTSLRTAKGSMGQDALAMLKYNKDSCRMHVFCLEHALETWTQLQQIGGANIMLLCHPEYPRAESAAKVITEELGMNHAWKDITFKEATDEDIGRIQLALQDEDAEPTSSDWAVKMGINIYYSAKQSKSPLYSKQVPYNSIIYKAFGLENPDSWTDDEGQRSGTRKKKVAGWWCGKVWMSNQVHPLLALGREEQNHDMVYSKSMFCTNSYDKIQEPSTRSATLINQSLSKRTSGRKEGDSVEKSRAKKKRCTASDEATFHCSGIGMISEATHDQPRNFDDHVKHKDGDESEEASNTQQHQQHEFQSMNIKTSSKWRKDDKRNNKFHELQDEKDDIDCRLDIDSIENTTIGDWDNSPQQGLGVVKVKSGVKLQGSNRKPSKCKANDDLLIVDKKLQKMGKKASTTKQKNDKTNRQFRENHSEDNNVVLHEDNGYEATQDNWDKIPKEKTDDVKAKYRGKMQSVKRKNSKEGCDRGDEATIDNWDEIPKEKTDDIKVKSEGKMRSVKKKASKRQSNDGLRNGDKGVKFSCDIEGCDMSFSTQQDLLLHKRDICPVKGCKQKFFCHKYLLQHRKVHLDERPLMCTWAGCKKTFKWPWARTEHMRVHTGVRPYACTEPGCTQTFRFVSDFSRHKRKTGHSCDKKRKKST